MNLYVIDTNVWVTAAKDIKGITSIEEEAIRLCLDWLEQFVEAEDKRLVVDLHYEILGEYRKHLSTRSVARDLLDQLERKPRERIVDIDIQLDADGYALVPAHLEIADRNDRKFIAVVLGCVPDHAPIVNGTDTDWDKEKARLSAHGILVLELCPNYIGQKRNRSL